MYLLNLLIYISRISALTKYIHSSEIISLIVDMPINRILNEDSSKPTGVYLKEDVSKNEKVREFIWDKYFSQAFFYFIEFENFPYFTIEGKQKFKCLCNEEEIFGFEIELKFSHLLNFTDNNFDKFKVFKRGKAVQEYIICSKERHYENVLNVFDYVNLIEKNPLQYSKLIRMFDILKNTLRNIFHESEQFLKNDRTICLKIWEINRIVINFSITFIKSLATLKIPSLNKLEYLEPFEEFMAKKKMLSELMNELKEIISLRVKNIEQDNIENENVGNQNFCKNAIFIIEYFEGIDIIEIHESYIYFIHGLESISRFSEEIKNKVTNDKKNMFDADDKIVEKFIDKHYFLFLEYCDIMCSCDEVYLDEYLYHTSLMVGNTYKMVLEEMFFDIVVAKEMKKYLETYKYDKTDFLIFARTDYFKNKLFDKILNNLYVLTHSLVIEKKNKNKMYNKMEFLSQEDQKLKSRIGDLYNQLDPIFNLVKKNKTLFIDEYADNMYFNMHQNLSDNKNLMGNEPQKIESNQMTDEEKLEHNEKKVTKQHENESRPEDGSKVNEYSPCDHANLDENLNTDNEQKIDNFSAEDSDRSCDENRNFQQNLFNESQTISNAENVSEINFLYVPDINNNQRGEEISLNEKSEESNMFKNEKRTFIKKDLESENLFINDETGAKENLKLNFDNTKCVRCRFDTEQDIKKETGLINGLNFNYETKLKNDIKHNEHERLIHKTKVNIKQHDNEKSNSKGYFLFRIILVMFSAVNLIGLIIFLVIDKR